VRHAIKVAAETRRRRRAARSRGKAPRDKAGRGQRRSHTRPGFSGGDSDQNRAGDLCLPRALTPSFDPAHDLTRSSPRGLRERHVRRRHHGRDRMFACLELRRKRLSVVCREST
jgi:hypothetical protein